ncbi:hypothetical protein pipiens_018297 [Culex pipiens pipiens]|uniref:MADF domain-containing protein n=1 Tax=Culex pipiens pipiens TaxID=38569 RepID=A0ABD1CCE8_CULPP
MVQGNKNFNVRLIALVKAHPIIWNRNDQNYRSTRNRRENHLVEIWKHIASEIGQEMTPDMCSAKWSNLRGNYSRYLRNIAVGNPGKFFMSEEMKFLLPHMDVKLPEETAPGHHDTEENCMNGPDCVEAMEEEDSEGSGSGPTGANPLRRCKHLVVDSQNTDAVFLLSLLPDLGRMTPAQKRLFKQGALELCQLILD